MPTLHVHIGEAKTGTTSVQTAFQMNREALAEAGFWYPVAAGYRRHADMVAALEPKLGSPRLRERKLTTEAEWRDYSEKLIAAFDKEHAAHAEADCILSSEHFPSLSRMGHAVMQKFVSERFDRIRVYFYFRNPVDFEISIYSTRIKAGSAVHLRDEAKFVNGFEAATRRHNRLRNWEETFGKANVEVIFFDRNRLRNGTIVDDLLTRIGVDPAKMVTPEGDKNEALNLVSLEVLRRFNGGLFDALGYDARQRRVFARALGRVTHGESLAVRPETAKRIEKAHSKGIAYYAERSGVPVDEIMRTKRVRAQGPTLETYALDVEDALRVIGEIKKSFTASKADGLHETAAEAKEKAVAQAVAGGRAAGPVSAARSGPGSGPKPT